MTPPLRIVVVHRTEGRLRRWHLAPDAQLEPVLEALARLGAEQAWAWTERGDWPPASLGR